MDRIKLIIQSGILKAKLLSETFITLTGIKGVKNNGGSINSGVLDATIQEIYVDTQWFTDNATFVLLPGQKANLLQTGTYKLGDGTTQLSALSFLGSSSGVSWGAIIGTLSDQTDLQNALNTIQSDIDTHEANTSNPHNVTKAQVGLGNVDNTSDANKPVSIAQQAALDDKVNIGSITSNTILKGSGTDTATNSQITDDGTNVGVNKPVPTAKWHLKSDDNIAGDDAVIIENIDGTVLFIIHSDGSVEFMPAGAMKNIKFGDNARIQTSNGGQGLVIQFDLFNCRLANDFNGQGYNLISFGNLGATGATLTGLTASRIVLTDGSKNLISSSFDITDVVQKSKLITESFTYTGSPFTLSNSVQFVILARINSLILDESDPLDLTIVGTTATVTNPSFGTGDKFYLKYLAV